MKILMVRVLGLVLLLGVGGCSGPLMLLPGGGLSGPEASLSAAPLSPDGGVMVLETRPKDPYSVNVGYTVVDGSIHIDPAVERRWYQHIVADADVRIQLDGAKTIYPAKAVVVEDPLVLARFEADRVVLRIEAR